MVEVSFLSNDARYRVGLPHKCKVQTKELLWLMFFTHATRSKLLVACSRILQIKHLEPSILMVPEHHGIPEVWVLVRWYYVTVEPVIVRLST